MVSVGRQPHGVEMVWANDRTLHLDGITLLGLRPDDGFEHLIYLGQARSDADRFITMKTPGLYERLSALLDEIRPRRILEIGIYQGGSTAFISKVARPEKIVAIELATERVEALDDYARSLPAGQDISVHYGVDQADVGTVTAILDREFGGEPIDAVVDDGSHALEQTKTSFEALWPRLSPGGCYIIEDWSWECVDFDALGLERPDGSPIRPMVLDLVTASGMDRSTVAAVHTDVNFATIVRSDHPVPDGWKIDDELGKISEPG